MDGAPARGLPTQPPLKHGVERLPIKGLGEVVVHAGGKAAAAILIEGIGGHCNDWGSGRRACVVCRKERLDGAGRLKAVEHRHMSVHQDDIVGPLGAGEHTPERLHSLAPIDAVLHPATGFL